MIVPKKIAAAMLGIVAAFTVGVVTPAPAYADGAGHNGGVTYTSGSPDSLEICHNWGTDSCSSGYYYLPKNKSSRDVWSDTDGYRVPYGYHAVDTIGKSKHTYGTGWHKISGSLSNHVVKLTKD